MKLLAMWLSLAGNLSAGVFGVVRAASGHPLPGAEVQVQSESTGARWRTEADENGRYQVTPLPAGMYKVTVRMGGFRTASRVGVVVDAGQETPLDFALELVELHQMVTVVSGRDELDPTGGSDSLLLTRQSPGAALPANGRDFRASFDLMPGVVVTPAAASDAGQFTANGARPNSHAFRVDGVSANTGVGSSALPGSFPGASLPAMTAIGSTENLVAPESTQSVELRTSSFAPEFGERPGAEALITTRSGSSEYHGEFFGQIRHRSWHARDWFANSRGLAYERPSYRRLGGVFGGPIRRDRTFFFVSAEKSRIADTGLQLVSVPTLETRENAPESVRFTLQFMPRPTGPELGGGTAEGLLALGRTAKMNSLAFRLDHTLGAGGTLFARFVRAPSSTVYTQLYANQGRLDWLSGTLGVTLAGSGGTVHDLRFNYSGAAFESWTPGALWSQDIVTLAGMLPRFTFDPQSGEILSVTKTPIDSVSPLLPGADTAFRATGLSIPGFGQVTWGDFGRVRQDQWEARDTVSRQAGNHQVRAGIDFIHLQPSRQFPLTSARATAPSLQGLLEGAPLPVTYTHLERFGGSVSVISLFVQDTVRVSEWFNVMYGLRWELTPPTAEQVTIPTVTGLWTGTDWETMFAGDINGTAPWPMRYHQFAPRVGAAYRLRGSGVVLRAGAGLFYDTRLGAAINPVNGAPFNTWELSGGTGLGAAVGALNPAGIPWQLNAAPDVEQFLTGPYPALRLPMSYQWRVALEKGIGSAGVGSVAYVGGAGRNLLGNRAYVEPGTGVLRRFITLTGNTSGYQGLQARYSGSLAPSMYGSVSYAWSHSVDDGSQDSSVFLIHPGYTLRDARGSSAFDVRHALTAALSYQVPRTWLAGWTISGIFRARSGFPVDVRNSEQAFGLGFDNVGRPDLVPEAPLWIADASVAGRRRLNPAAFREPPAGRRGTLGRNALAGNGLMQTDASLRREFAWIRGTSLELGLQIFNLLNSPSFADPTPFLSSPWFGQPTSMQNLMLGSGSPNGGLTPLFQSGGSRSVEFGFRISF